MSKDAAARLQRLLTVIPLFADRTEVSREEVERRTGVDVETLLEDLEAVTVREDEPAGFTSSIEATVEPERLSIRTNQFLRPMRLNVPELCALELGLAMLAASSPADEQRVIGRARERGRALIGRMPAGKDEEGLWHAVAPTGSDSEHLSSLREAWRARRKARVAYRRGGEEDAQERVVHVYGLIPLNGTWYIAAHDESGAGVRFFRLDRVEGVTVLSENYEIPEKLSVEALMSNGKPFHAARADTLTVRYSPRVARWIAEREKVPLAADGSLTLEHPLADVDWAVRHVLQYGPDAEVLSPEPVRAAIRERLERSLDGGVAS